MWFKYRLESRAGVTFVWSHQSFPNDVSETAWVYVWARHTVVHKLSASFWLFKHSWLSLSDSLWAAVFSETPLGPGSVHDSLNLYLRNVSKPWSWHCWTRPLYPDSKVINVLYTETKATESLLLVIKLLRSHYISFFFLQPPAKSIKSQSLLASEFFFILDTIFFFSRWVSRPSLPGVKTPALVLVVSFVCLWGNTEVRVSTFSRALQR